MGAGGTTTRGHGADFLAEVERNKNPAGVFLVSPFSLEICSCAGFTMVTGGAFLLCWEHVQLAFRLHYVQCLEVYTRPPSWAERGLQAQQEGACRSESHGPGAKKVPEYLCQNYWHLPGPTWMAGHPPCESWGKAGRGRIRVPKPPSGVSSPWLTLHFPLCEVQSLYASRVTSPSSITVQWCWLIHNSTQSHKGVGALSSHPES